MNAGITGLYAGLIAVLLIALSYRVSKLRLKSRVGIGDQGVVELQSAIRVQGNLVEYAPIALLLLLIAELNSAAPALALHAAGATLVLARLGHAFGLSSSPDRTPGRFYGTLLTWLVILVLGVLLIVNALN